MMINMKMTAKAASAIAPTGKPKPTINSLYKELEETKPGSEDSKRISEKILEKIFDVGSR